MRRVPTIAFLVACVVGAARAQTYHACLEYNGNYYDLVSTPSGSTLDRYQGATFVNRQQYAAFHLPAAGTTTWDEGVAFAATMQTRNSWLNNEPTSAATWVHEANSDSWMWFTTVNGVPNQFEFTTAKCHPPPSPNCPSAAGPGSGVNCNADENCCGAGGIFPQCIPQSSGDKCCTHFNGAAACAASQSCCGEFGPGASSSAFCCDAGSTCCHAQSLTQGATCCPAGTMCCAGSSIGFCCGFDEVCDANLNLNRCAPGPIVVDPTPVPVRRSTDLNLNRGCISVNGWFYDLRSDESGTTLDRYQGEILREPPDVRGVPPTGVQCEPGVCGFSPFHSTRLRVTVTRGVGRSPRPTLAPGGPIPGVAFAAAMQTRNAWVNNEQTLAGSWFEDSVTGNDRFTFETTVNGVPTQFVFVTEACPALA
jgi:hypothetical protein